MDTCYSLASLQKLDITSTSPSTPILPLGSQIFSPSPQAPQIPHTALVSPPQHPQPQTSQRVVSYVEVLELLANDARVNQPYLYLPITNTEPPFYQPHRSDQPSSTSTPQILPSGSTVQPPSFVQPPMQTMASLTHVQQGSQTQPQIITRATPGRPYQVCSV